MATIAAAVAGVENTKRMDTNPQITNTQTKSEDPFSSQRKPTNPVPLKEAVAGTNSATRSKDLPIGSPPKDRKLSSDEWDASKTPPSRFQQRKGSVYATPNSRDGHVDKNHERDAAYHQKLKEKGWFTKKRRDSKSSE